MGQIRPFRLHVRQRQWEEKHGKAWWFGKDRDEEERQRKYPFDPRTEVLHGAPLMRELRPATEGQALMEARPNEEPTPVSTCISPLVEQLDVAVARLKPGEQELIWWLFWERGSLRRAARMLGISHQGLGARVGRILRQIGDHMATSYLGDKTSDEWTVEREWDGDLPVPDRRAS